MSSPQSDDKVTASVEHVDNKFEKSPSSSGSMVKDMGVEEQLDRFGAHTKTDPVEIALVRKLDLYIMVCT